MGRKLHTRLPFWRMGVCERGLLEAVRWELGCAVLDIRLHLHAAWCWMRSLGDYVSGILSKCTFIDGLVHNDTILRFNDSILNLTVSHVWFHEVVKDCVSRILPSYFFLVCLVLHSHTAMLFSRSHVTSRHIFFPVPRSCSSNLFML